MKTILIALACTLTSLNMMGQACIVLSNYMLTNVGSNTYKFSVYHSNPSNGTKTLSVNVTCGGTQVTGFPVCVDVRTNGTYTSPNFSCGNLSSIVITMTPYSGSSCGGNPCAGTSYSTGGSPLPIVMKDFSGTNKNNTNQIFWSSVTETSIASFDVESSTDAINYKNIGNVKAKGSNSTYNFTDYGTSVGKTYYRLKINEVDGKSYYSNIIWLNSDNSNNKTIIYPTPAQTSVTISIADDALLNTKAIVKDIKGATVISLNINSMHQTIDVSKLQSGIYFVQFSNGTVGKIIK